MKTKTFLLTLAAFVTLISCKKDYTCECTGPGGKQTMFTATDTKENARKKCNDYHSSDTALTWPLSNCKLK